MLKRLATPITFILIGAVARIIPHVPNFAPIGAMALFGGAYMNKKQAFLLPVLAMILSDFIVGFDSLPMRLTVYGTFLMMVVVGIWLKKNLSLKNVFISSLFASVLFFMTTNFSVWIFGSMYPHNIGGLGESYFFAIPFFRNTLLGDLFYSGAFFGGYELVRSLLRRDSRSKIFNFKF
ncbi:MAG: hypothetical protein HYV90_00685 [Candidatus Woesebacteria bacterium]|nr:MAG: hypothetical protein HYV90_00685 [Candidatus Woesebacteria bacterium]